MKETEIDTGNRSERKGGRRKKNGEGGEGPESSVDIYYEI